MNESIRSAYPLLAREGPTGEPVIYLDSAATALRPSSVSEAMAQVLRRHTGGVHRANHFLGDEATQLYEGARQRVAWFINAEPNEVVFTRNTTDALNMLAHGWRRPGRVLTSIADHHSAQLPWSGEVERLPVDDQGLLDMGALERALASGPVSMLCLSHTSNVTGTTIDARAVAERAHAAGAVLALDCAQSAPHRPLDVAELDCDFLSFSGHKLGGPGNIGVLYGRAERLEEVATTVVGGGVVENVGDGRYELNPAPWRLEAGTPGVEVAVGLHAAIDFLDSIGMEVVHEHERALTAHLLARLRDTLPRLPMVGPDDGRRCGIVSLGLPDESPHQFARALSDSFNICVRSGFHCAEPLHRRLGLTASLRASMHVYTVPEELDRFVDGLAELLSLARRH